MNRVYFAEVDPDYGGVFIAAKNGKEARKIAEGTWVAEQAETYIDLRITRCWSVKETNYEGELDIYKINELGLAWWACGNCDNEDFEILNREEYRCKNCGEVQLIPYINC